MFGPLPAIVKFCALRPRSTVTGVAFAGKPVNSNPSEQKAICEIVCRGPMGRSVIILFLIRGFIDDIFSLMCELRQLLNVLIPLISSERIRPDKRQYLSGSRCASCRAAHARSRKARCPASICALITAGCFDKEPFGGFWKP
jgi:hypothetical protein